MVYTHRQSGSETPPSVPQHPKSRARLLACNNRCVSQPAASNSMEMKRNSKASKSVTRRNRRQVAGIASIVLVLAALMSPEPTNAARLKSQTVDAFGHYVQLSEIKMDGLDANQAAFLWIDRLPVDQRAAALQRLRRGEVIIEPLETLDAGKSIAVPDGLVHDWIATVFIPGATLRQTLSFEEDYNEHQKFFQPDVVSSKILSRDGNDFVVYFRLYRREVVTSILDTEHDVHYQLLDATRATSRSHTTRIQEVENAGTRDEKLKPIGDDNGFLWRMQTYWRFQEKDGGTYAECRSISLTRDIPTGLGWMVGPFVKSIPRESLTFTLSKTRSAIMQRSAARS
jgi:hypothetical protein